MNKKLLALILAALMGIACVMTACAPAASNEETTSEDEYEEEYEEEEGDEDEEEEEEGDEEEEEEEGTTSEKTTSKKKKTTSSKSSDKKSDTSSKRKSNTSSKKASSVEVHDLFNSVQQDLSSYFNKDTVSFQNEKNSGNFDELAKDGIACFLGDLVKEKLDSKNCIVNPKTGVKFQIGKIDGNNKQTVQCLGQTIKLSSPTACDHLEILGGAGCGSKDGDFTINFQGGGSYVSSQFWADWADKSAEDIVLLTEKRFWNKPNTDVWEAQSYAAIMCGYPLEISDDNENAGKIVSSITLPDNRMMQFFALSAAIAK